MKIIYDLEDYRGSSELVSRNLCKRRNHGKCSGKKKKKKKVL
jgi:hypothetical protein